MNSVITKTLVSACLGLVGAYLLNSIGQAQSPQVMQPTQPATQPAITLDPPTGLDLQAHLYDSSGNALPVPPANFRRLGEAHAGEPADPHTLTLRFAQSTKLSSISVSKDFRIEQGGSCVQGNVYAANTTCTLLIRFTPQGPGNRRGQLTVSNSVTSEPMAFGLLGFGYSPIVSFVPALITTVPGTYPSNVGLLSGAQNLTVDGNDDLYAADTGNNEVRMLNSGGAWVNIGTSSVTAPIGVGVDMFGEVYASSGNFIFETYAYPYPWFSISGTGTDACRVGTPCTFGPSASYPSGEVATQPGQITFDSSNNMYFAEQTSGAAISSVMTQSGVNTFNRVYVPFTYQSGKPTTLAYYDGYLFSYWPVNCQLVAQSLYNAENFFTVFQKVAAGRVCGFAGDGGLAGAAEISGAPGQIAFDIAGNLYYADSGNQRVRRIENTTGTIRTIAGSGVAGYAGDGGGSFGAALSYPTGVAVNAEGAVFVISGTGVTSGGPQVIRQIGPAGYKSFGNQPKGVASAPVQIVMSNTGNSQLVMSAAQTVGPNAADFSIDPGTTTCLLTAGSVLNSGQSCYLGIKFAPSATGSRTATLNLLDNTVPGINSITLVGVGTLPVPTFKITSPANGASFTSGTAVTFSVSVTSTSSPAPTGTVQFKVDGANYGSPATLSSGAASTSVTGLTQTGHTLSATYSGDANYAAAGPISVTITVTAVKLGSFVTLSQTASAAASCAAPQFAATVAGKSGPVPTGQVQLLDSGAVIASATLSAGEAMLTPRPLTPGTHNLIASYGGDVDHLPSLSPALVDVVAPSTVCSGPVSGGLRTTP